MYHRDKDAGTEITDKGRLRDMDVPTLHKVPKPEPVTARDASGETADNFEVALAGYVEAALDCAAHDSNQPYERLRGRRELARQQVMRLYRAATGEVVCTGYLRHMKDRIIELRGAVLTNRDWFTDPDGVPVDLVLRREKEEG